MCKIHSFSVSFTIGNNGPTRSKKAYSNLKEKKSCKRKYIESSTNDESENEYMYQPKSMYTYLFLLTKILGHS